MRKRLFLTFWCLLLVVSYSEAKPLGRGTAGVRPKQTAVTEQVVNPITLYKESHALLIGATAYQHWPKLRGVLTDVTAVQAALEQQGFTVTTVLDPDRATLTAAFDNFINQYGLDANNRLLIYFAGHGYTVKKTMGEMGYIVPIDAPDPSDDLKGFLRSGLDMAQIEVYAQRIDSRHALFVFDSCFSGSVFALSGRGAPPVITYKTAMPVRQFITSGSADEEVPDVSMFRKHFVSGLGGEADSNQDGYITGKELGIFLEDKVINYSKDTQHPQFGTLRNPELDKGDFVFQVLESGLDPCTQPSPPASCQPDKGFWDAWQPKMQTAFDKVVASKRGPAAQRLAWEQFLANYPDNNPYSQEDEQLRDNATTAMIQIDNGSGNGHDSRIMVDTAYICKKLATEEFAILWPESKQDCGKVDELLSSVRNLVDEAKNKRFKGKQKCADDYVAALMSELEKVVNNCGNECSEIGRSAGELAAQIFCAVSEEIGRAARFDGLRDAPNMICGESYKTSCESSFVSQAMSMCPKYTKGTAFENYYRASQNGCCSYEQ